MFCILRIFYWPLKDISIQESTFWSKYSGLLVLTGRPVNRPAGRPAKTIVLAGQKRPKLNISRNMHDFA